MIPATSKRAISVTAFALFIGVCMQSPADELWQKGIEQFKFNTGWVAGSTVITSEQFNKKGKLRSSEQRIFRALQTEAGVQSELISAYKNGKDITEEERRKAEEENAENEDENNDEDSPFPNPFDPELQEVVTYRRTGQSINSGTDIVLIEYEFRMQIEPDSEYVGNVYLDSVTGVPVEFEATVEPLPRLTKFVRLAVRFQNDANRWFPVHMEFEGAGGWFFVYRHFKSTIEFTDYFREDE